MEKKKKIIIGVVVLLILLGVGGLLLWLFVFKKDCSEDSDCKNGGTCDTDEGECKCYGKWTGATCDEEDPDYVAPTPAPVVEDDDDVFVDDDVWEDDLVEDDFVEDDPVVSDPNPVPSSSNGCPIGCAPKSDYDLGEWADDYGDCIIWDTASSQWRNCPA